MKEGVAIACHSVTQSWTLLEQPPLPDQVSRPLGSGDVLVSVSAPHTMSCQHQVTYTRSPVTPVDQTIFVVS